MQAVGIIAAVGDSVDTLKVGSAAAVMTFGSYAEFMIVCNILKFCYHRKSFYTYE